MGTPLLRLPPSPGDTPTAYTRSDALGNAAELRFADSAARYSHDDWKREQHAEPTCHSMMSYVSIGQPSVLPPDVLACYPSHKRPSLSDIKELAGDTTDDDIVLLVRNPTLPPTRSDKPNPVGRAACLLNDELVRIYALLLMRPRIMQACHSTASCHLGTTRTLRMLERFYWWIGMNVCTRWWLSPLLEVPSAENPTADCPLAHHLNASTGRFRCRRQCLLLRPPSGHTTRQHLHPAVHRSLQSSGRHVPRHCR